MENYIMVKSYIYGRVEKQPTKRTTVRKKIKSSSEIDQDQVAWNQHQNKIMNDKIHEAYYDSMKRLNRIQGMVIEGAMRKHKKNEGGY